VSATAAELRRLLKADRAALNAVFDRHRRCRASHGLDPLDRPAIAMAGVTGIGSVAEAIHDGHRPATPELIAAIDAGDTAAIRAIEAEILDREFAPGLGSLYLATAALRDQADRIARKLRRAPERTDRGSRAVALALHAFLDACGDERRHYVLSLAGHLLAVGVRPGVALALLESWDRDHCKPPLGGQVVDELVRWVAGRQAASLEGAA
jgi:hypothetical protein